MRNRMYGGVRGRKTKVGEKLLRFPPTRINPDQLIVNLAIVLWLSFETKSAEVLVGVTIMAMHSQSLSAYDAFQSKI